MDVLGDQMYMEKPIVKRLVKEKSLSRQVYDVLCNSIMEMKPYQNKLPSEEDLAKQLGVSRATVREALKYLMMERVTTSIHGRGTFAHPSVFQLENRIDQDNDFGQMLKKHYGDVNVDMEWEYPGSANAAYLSLFHDKPSVKGDWIYTANQSKRLYIRYFIPQELLLKPLEKDLSIQSLPQLSREYMKEDIDYCSMECRIKVDDEACMQLDIAQGTPLLCWDEIIYDVGDEPVGVGEVFVHPDNMVMSMVARFEF